MPSPARVLAFRILRDTGRGPVLAERLAHPDVAALDPRERAFLHELVLGTLRVRGWLDHAIEGVSGRPLREVDDAVREALRLGAYQVLRLRVPSHAAVSESVGLAAEEMPRAKGFVNAVLRRLVREGAPPEPDPAGDPMVWLTTAGSLPRWLAQRWLGRLGAETAIARARALLVPPPVAFRVNPRLEGAESRLEAAGVRWSPLRVPGARRALDGLPPALAAEGIVYAQDEGSQLVAALAVEGLSAGAVLDACAAPGGKTTVMADAAPAAFVAAMELVPRRARSLADHLRRWQAPNARVFLGDARTPAVAPRFAAVLLDAPCSGLGTLARHPDIRWRANPADLPRQGQRQRTLLAALSSVVRPGGTLVYSTCSLEREENEDVIEPFLAGGAPFRLAPLPGWAAPFASGPFLRTLPERDGGDGFFAVRLTRTG